MERIILRHRSAAHADQHEFPLAGFPDVLVGRDPDVHIRFDNQEVVSRRHARLSREGGEPPRVLITDLQSRNGTFVNGRRITAPVALAHGDVVQFGRGGPELDVILDPAPAALSPCTRVVRDAEPVVAAPTVHAAAGATWRSAGAGSTPKASAGIGRRTIERLIGDASNQGQRRTIQIAAALTFLFVGSLALLAYTSHRRDERIATDVAGAKSAADAAASRAGMTPSDIAAAYTDVNVMIESAWKLIYAPTGEQVYHEYVVEQDQGGKPVAGDDGEMKRAPLYLRLSDGTYEPSLVLDKGRFSQNEPVGGAGRGSGFVVTPEGFIMTNGHVAAPWDRGGFWESLPPGLVLDLQTRKVSRIERIPRWIPTQTRLLGQKPLEGRLLAGRHDYLDVTFSRRSMRLPARLVRVSDKHDVALIKVEVVEPLKKVELHDNYDSVAAGLPITVMGFPGMSANPVTVTRSRDYMVPVNKVVSVPDPTVTPGIVSRVFRGAPVQNVAGNDAYASQLGDVYQLTAVAGPGNSGGPVFDDRGRVIAVHYAGARNGGIGLAVPIRYGIELLGTGSVVTR